MPRHAPEKIHSLKELRELQRLMGAALFRPLAPDWRMQKKWIDGTRTRDVIAEFIKPNDRLTSFERLEIYNRQYWFRVIDCFYDDYPGLRAVLGERRFRTLAREYLTRYPSTSFALRNLGSRIEEFIRKEPQWTEPRQEIALDMARFEWAQVIAFDGEVCPAITTDELLDSNPARLRLGLQPYITLLKLNHPVDDVVLAVKKRDTALRAEASNAVEAAPKKRRNRPIRLPKRQTVFVAVHRHDNLLYFKRIEPEAFAILDALRRGVTLANACADGIAASPRRNIDWAARIKDWFQTWSALGWFCAYRRSRSGS